jgi:predicted enzyme related to lactoylglutathione lyase
MPNPVVHFEIMATENVEGLRSFYADVFGWKMNADNPMDYALVDTGGQGIRGGIGRPMHGAGYATFYVAVDDLGDALRRIGAKGGQTIMPPTDIPGDEVSIAMFRDPAGNLIGLVKMGEGPQD